MTQKDTFVFTKISAVLRRLLPVWLAVFSVTGGSLIPAASCAVSAEELSASFSEEEALTPFELHGKLSVTGSSLTDESGETFQLRGVTTGNLLWASDYISYETFLTLRDHWYVNTVRLSVPAGGEYGYAGADESGRQTFLDLIDSGIHAAADAGMYVIVDWHIAEEGDPNYYKETALHFFEELSFRFRDDANVLYEICSNPHTPATWEGISAYSADIIDAIRANVPDAVVLIGTPDWSQNIDSALAEPVQRDNLLYSVHCYANGSCEELRQKTALALEADFPVIVSQFNLSDPAGSGEIDTDQADLWLSLLNHYQAGYMMEKLSAQGDGGSLLTTECERISNWDWNELTTDAHWFIDRATMDLSYLYSSAVPSSEAATSTASWPLSNGCVLDVTEYPGVYGYPESSEYSVVLTNPTQTAVNSWRIRMVWSEEITPQDYWSCDIGGSGNSRLIVPKDYNTVIPSGSSVSFGFAVTGASVPTLVGVSLE